MWLYIGDYVCYTSIGHQLDTNRTPIAPFSTICSQNQSRIYQRIWNENHHAANCDNLDIPAKLAPAANFIVSNNSFWGNSSQRTYTASDISSGNNTIQGEK